MTNTTQNRSVEERNAIIGGSSLSNFYSDTPWACLRRLAYQFLGTSPTHDRTYTTAMQLGHFYEDKLRRWFSETQSVDCIEEGFVLHPEFPFLGGHPDGIFGDDGIIEIKTATSFSYCKLKEQGIYDAYKDQLTLYMNILERYNAYFVVGCSEDINQKFIVKFEWDSERYTKIINNVLSFMMYIISDKLPPRCGVYAKGRVSACRRCEFRGVCIPLALKEEEYG